MVTDFVWLLLLFVVVAVVVYEECRRSGTPAVYNDLEEDFRSSLKREGVL